VAVNENERAPKRRTKWRIEESNGRYIHNRKKDARATEVAPVGAHLERHVPRRRRARRGALELPG